MSLYSNGAVLVGINVQSNKYIPGMIFKVLNVEYINMVIEENLPHSENKLLPMLEVYVFLQDVKSNEKHLVPLGIYKDNFFRV